MCLKAKVGVQVICMIEKIIWWNNWFASAGFLELTFIGTKHDLQFLFRTWVLINFFIFKRESQSSGQYCNPGTPEGQEILFWNSNFIHERPRCVCRHMPWESICNFPIQTVVEYMGKKSFGQYWRSMNSAQLCRGWADKLLFNKMMCWEALILTKVVTLYRVVQSLVQKWMHYLKSMSTKILF